VHRLLAAALGYEPLPAEYLESGSRDARGGGMQAQCDNMNRRHLMSQLAGRASGALHTNIFFARRVVVDLALVIRLRGNGAVVLVPRFGLEGAVVLGRTGESAAAAAAARAPGAPAPAPAPLLLFDEAAQTLCAAADPAALRLRIFQEVKVALSVEARGPRGRRELVIRIVDPPFAPWPRAEELPPGTVVEDRTAARKAAQAAPAAAVDAAAAAAAVGRGKKRKLVAVGAAVE